MKTTEYKTKNKVIQETRQEEASSEVIDYLRSSETERDRSYEVTEWMKTQFTATAKSREILEDWMEGKENDGERH